MTKITPKRLADGLFSHPSVGSKLDVELQGTKVRLVFHCDSKEKAKSVAEDIVEQLREGTLSLTVMGKPKSVTGRFDA